MEGNDFLSQDFIDEFPLHESGAHHGDHLVADISDDFSEAMHSDNHSDSQFLYQISNGGNGNALPGIGSQPEYNVLNQAPYTPEMKSPPPTFAPPIIQTQSSQARPSYPVLERVQLQTISQTKPEPQLEPTPQSDPEPKLADEPQTIVPTPNIEDSGDDDENHEEESNEPVVVTKQVRQRKPKGTKKKKDPNAPSAPMSAYSFFFKETQAKVKQHNPSAKFGDISRSVAGLWEALDESEKASFRKKSEDDRARYNKELEVYKSTLPQSDDQPAPKIPPKSVKVVYLGGKMTTTTTNNVPPPQTLADDSNHVFQGPSLSSMSISNDLEVRQDEVTENECIRDGCTNFAVKSPEWEDEYCSNECAVQHCKDVFNAFVAETKSRK